MYFGEIHIATNLNFDHRKDRKMALVTFESTEEAIDALIVSLLLLNHRVYFVVSKKIHTSPQKEFSLRPPLTVWKYQISFIHFTTFFVHTEPQLTWKLQSSLLLQKYMYEYFFWNCTLMFPAERRLFFTGRREFLN